MNSTPTFVVLTDLADSHNRVPRYAAALAAAVGGRLVLLHAYQEVVLDSEFGYTAGAFAEENQRAIRAGLQEMAAALPVSVEVEITVGPLRDALTDAVRRHQPLLLLMGLSATHDWFDRLLSNSALPVLRATHHPLLLVPEGGRQQPGVPRHVLIAADGEDFSLNAAARQARALLETLGVRTSVMAVRPSETQAASAPQPAPADVLASIRRGLHLPELPDAAFHPFYEDDAAAGILRAVGDLEPDLLVFIARRRSFLGELFHRSVTARVASESPVPILILPEE